MTAVQDDAPRFGVVILNWNAREDTLALLRRVVPQLLAGDRAIIVDNASSDDSVRAIRDEFPAVEVIANDANRGFAGGCNVGIERAVALDANWLLLLNNDTHPPVDFLPRLRTAVATYGVDHASLQPLVVSAADPERIDTAGIAPSWWPGARDLAAGRPVREVGPQPREIFGANGAALLLRADLAAALGGFDEALFILFEDLEIALRLRASGQRALLLPHIHLPHRRGISGKHGAREGHASRRRKAWLQRNIIAIALRAWPTHVLLLAAPWLFVRAGLAWWWSRPYPDIRCRELWRSAWRDRSAMRAGLVRHGVDRWFGCDPLAK